MTDAADGSGSDPSAEELFARFLAHRGRGGPDFEELLRRHEERADALRALHSMWLSRSGDGPAPASGSETRGALEDRLRALAAPPSAGAPGGGGVAPDRAEAVEGYRILERLGEGGFGIVYRAEQLAPVRRPVAIKVIKPGMDSREVLARFEAERQALALMSHPAIARILDAGTTRAGRPYFAMEHIAGEPITAYADRHDLPVREILELFIPVCEAVQHAHHKAIIHRDLKPSNILVSLESGRPTPKIIDFGVAKALQGPLTDRTLYTSTGQLIGTPAYMSPEQAERSGLDVDTRTDVYSLGVVLYELLTGSLPVDPELLRRSSPADLPRLIREEETPKPSVRLSRLETTRRSSEPDPAGPRRPTRLARDLRGDLDWIVLRAMHKDRTHRYDTAAQLGDDIRRHLADEPILAGPPGLSYRIGKLLRRHRGAVITAAAGLVLVAVVTGAMWWLQDADYRRRLDAARSAVAAGDVDAARAAIDALGERGAGRESLRRVRAAVAALDHRIRSEQSRARLRQAEGSWSAYVERRAEGTRRRAAWREVHLTTPGWVPVWERTEELARYRELEAARARSRDAYDRAIAGYRRAISIAPPASPALDEARSALARTYRRLYELTRIGGSVTLGPEYFRRLGADLDPSLFARRGARVTVAVDPPDAEVHCFRYEEHDRRLVPLPFAAGRTRADAGRTVGAPTLEIESVTRADVAAGLRTGDRILAVAGESVRLESELARAVADIELGQAVPLDIEREGRARRLVWVPFPGRLYDGELAVELRPSRLVSTREQLGFTLRGYPLHGNAECRLGPGAGGDPDTRRAHLPSGRYLLRVRAPGHLEARHPLLVTDRDVDLEVRLHPLASVPEGFVHVPAGSFLCGGDPDAFQPLEAEESTAEDLLVARCEVTFGEYLEFLGDPDRAVDGDGLAEPRDPTVREWLASRGRARIDLLPRADGSPPSPLVRRTDEGAWRPIPWVRSLRWPVVGVSQLAAREYARWRTERAAHREREAGWTFRLPTDREWEKAARGVDGRLFVWGDYQVWSFCWCRRGVLPGKPTPAEVGLCPLDESPWGVRDLAGSASEHAVGTPAPPEQFASLRGGNWYNSYEYNGRAATRNGLLPWNRALNAGFRLVAERRPRR